jgi:serine/threonine protein kinase
VSDDPLFALLREVARTPDAIGLRGGDVVDRFELLREIGRGAFGIVFEARDTELGRLVAVKAMRPGTLAGDAFRLEARAAAALNHPNIVTLHDHGIANETPFLVLERLHGETLATRCARGASDDSIKER